LCRFREALAASVKHWNFDGYDLEPAMALQAGDSNRRVKVEFAAWARPEKPVAPLTIRALSNSNNLGAKFPFLRAIIR